MKDRNGLIHALPGDTGLIAIRRGDPVVGMCYVWCTEYGGNGDAPDVLEPSLQRLRGDLRVGGSSRKQMHGIVEVLSVKNTDGRDRWMVEVKKRDGVFAATLRNLRVSAGLSVAALANAAGLTRQSVDLLEKGERKPSLETAERLAIALGETLRVFEGCGIPE